ncbi:MAG: hypothetical protein WAV95_01750 [Azonexus sp.]
MKQALVAEKSPRSQYPIDINFLAPYAPARQRIVSAQQLAERFASLTQLADEYHGEYLL